jgi:dTDP-4-amino-4,6-dideoxygalactose transaminase
LPLVEYLLGVAAAILMLMLPKFVVKRKVERILTVRCFSGVSHLVFFKSGRSALSAVFSVLKQRAPESCILVPDYICNVVHKAAKHANMAVVEYPTDEKFRPDMDAVGKLLQIRKAAAVLFASIFGAQNNTRELVGAIRQADRRVAVILDECQNLTQDNRLYLDANTLLVGSFNMKNIYGVMGGFVGFDAIDFDLPEPNAPIFARIKQEIVMMGVLVKQAFKQSKTIVKRRQKGQTFSGEWPGPEYSYCNRTLPYRVDVMPIAKISLIRALQELRRIDGIEKSRKRRFTRLKKMAQEIPNIRIIETERIELSPYIPVEVENKSLANRLDLKGPYALENDPDSSLRPNSFAVYNNDHFRTDIAPASEGMN